MRSSARTALIPRPWNRPLFGRPGDGMLALLLLSISAAGSLSGISLWIAGHGHAALQAVAGAVLLIFALLVV